MAKMERTCQFRLAPLERLLYREGRSCRAFAAYCSLIPEGENSRRIGSNNLNSFEPNCGIGPIEKGKMRKLTGTERIAPDATHGRKDRQRVRAAISGPDR